MARPPRITIAAFPYHVIQRGNNRQTIFSLMMITGIFWNALH